jgi:RecA/RadA recombinase
MTGLEAANKRCAVFNISTGSKALDGILGGGIESRECLVILLPKSSHK